MQKLTSAFSCRIELRYRNSGASTDPRCDGCRCSKQDRRQCHRRAEHQSKHLPPLTYFNFIASDCPVCSSSILCSTHLQPATCITQETLESYTVYSKSLIWACKLHRKRIQSDHDENTLILCFKIVWLADILVMGFHHQQ